MATVNSFEELTVWQKAQEIGMLVYALAEENIKIAKDFSFKDQIKRAALSISNNIAEGFEYNNTKGFIRYLRIAKGSCGEVRNGLLFAIKVKYASYDSVELTNTKQLGGQIGNFIKYQKKKVEDQKLRQQLVTRNLNPQLFQCF
jgi:four helix bundle protein